jgi:hypothetical protein
MGIAPACSEDMATILPLKNGDFQFLADEVRLSGWLEYQGPYLKRVKHQGLDWICL